MCPDTSVTHVPGSDPTVAANTQLPHLPLEELQAAWTRILGLAEGVRTRFLAAFTLDACFCPPGTCRKCAGRLVEFWHDGKRVGPPYFPVAYCPKCSLP
jgi:hypothetical protein